MKAYSGMFWRKAVSCACGVAMAMLMAGCKADVPGEYLSVGEMEDILYDYHLAEVLAREQPKDSLALISYKANILKKHGVTEAEFDASLLYYTRHTELLQKVYRSLSDRFSDEAIAQGASADELSQFGQAVSSVDTADVWNGQRALLLFPNESLNSYSFKIKADTAYHKGDAVMLDFHTHFLYQDGMRSATAVLAVRHGNDSVTKKTIHLSTTSHFHLQIDDTGRIGIKEVKGFFILNTDRANTNATTLKMAAISDIRLIRMHAGKDSKAEGKDAARKDSLTAPLPGAPVQPMPSDTGKAGTVQPAVPLQNKTQPNNK